MPNAKTEAQIEETPERKIHIRKYGYRYVATNLGRILDTRTGEEILPFLDDKGMARVKLIDNKGEATIERVSFLIAMCFVPVADRNKRNRVIHMDGCFNNNRADNLIWVPDVE